MDERIKRSRKQEEEGAKRYGGTRNVMSGAGDVRKNDVRTEDLSIEFKNTTTNGYRLTRSDLEKAWRHALIEHRDVIFGIEWASMNLVGAPHRWVVLPEDDYLAMREDAAFVRMSRLGQELGT